MGGFGARLDQKSDKIDATNRCKNKSALGGTGGGRVRVRIDAFLRHLGDFDCHFGPYWPPKGFRNHIFSHKISKSRKNRGPKARPKQTWKFNRNSIPKSEAGGSKIERFALYLFQNRGFRGV